MKKRMLALLLGLLCAGLIGLRQHGHRRKGRNAVRADRRAARTGTHAGGGPPDGGGAVCGRSDARGAGRADVLRALSGDRRGGADGAV